MGNKIILNKKDLAYIEEQLWDYLCESLKAADGAEEMRKIVQDQDKIYLDLLKQNEFTDEEIEMVFKYIENYSL